jgi:uncharacterized protein YlxP (DUF503 family)
MIFNRHNPNRVHQADKDQEDQHHNIEVVVQVLANKEVEDHKVEDRVLKVVDLHPSLQKEAK